MKDMFIVCYDEELKTNLMAKGYKLFKKQFIQNAFVFVNDKSLKFDFESVGKDKYTYCNKLNF